MNNKFRPFDFKKGAAFASVIFLALLSIYFSHSGRKSQDLKSTIVDHSGINSERRVTNRIDSRTFSNRKFRLKFIDQLHASVGEPDEFIRLLMVLNENGYAPDHRSYELFASAVSNYSPEQLTLLIRSWPSGSAKELVDGSETIGRTEIVGLIAQYMAKGPLEKVGDFLEASKEDPKTQRQILSSLSDVGDFASVENIKKLTDHFPLSGDILSALSGGVYNRILNEKDGGRIDLANRYFTELESDVIAKIAATALVEAEVAEGTPMSDLGNWLLEQPPTVTSGADAVLAMKAVAKNEHQFAATYSNQLLARFEIERADEFVGTFGENFGRSDPQASIEWAAALPDSLARGRMRTLSSAFGNLAKTDPAAASTIAERFKRNPAVTSVYESIVRKDQN